MEQTFVTVKLVVNPIAETLDKFQAEGVEIDAGLACGMFCGGVIVNHYTEDDSASEVLAETRSAWGDVPKTPQEINRANLR